AFGAGGTGGLQSFIKSGSGTVTVNSNIVGPPNSSGAGPNPSNIFVKSGTMIWGNGAAVVTKDFSSIGQNGTDNGTLTMQGNGTFTSGTDFNVGDIASSQGTLNISDTAALTVGTATAGGFFVGSANASGSTASGFVNQSGGTLTVNRTA